MPFIVLDPDSGQGLATDTTVLFGADWSAGETIAANSITIDTTATSHSAITVDANGNIPATKLTIAAIPTEGLKDVVITASVTGTVRFPEHFAVTFYCAGYHVRDLTTIPLEAVDHKKLIRIIQDREREIDSWFMNDTKFRPKLIFRDAKEIDELVCYRNDMYHVYTLYPFISSITSLAFRTGSTSWQTMTQGVDSDYYSSVEDMQYGRIWLASEPSYERDGVKTTYQHGFVSIPHEVTNLCKRLVAIDLYMAALQVGENDVFTQRLEYLKPEVERLKTEIRQRIPMVIS